MPSPSAPDAAHLADLFTPLALSLARRWSRSYPHLLAEFQSEAAYALWRYAVAFSGPIEFFPSRARQRINRALGQTVRRERRQNLAAFHQPAEDLDPLSIVAAPRATVGAEMELAEVMGCLSETEQELVQEHAAGVSFPVIGLSKGIPAWRVRDSFRVAVEKARKRFGS